MTLRGGWDLPSTACPMLMCLWQSLTSGLALTSGTSVLLLWCLLAYRQVYNHVFAPTGAPLLIMLSKWTHYP